MKDHTNHDAAGFSHTLQIYAWLHPVPGGYQRRMSTCWRNPIPHVDGALLSRIFSQANDAASELDLETEYTRLMSDTEESEAAQTAYREHVKAVATRLIGEADTMARVSATSGSEAPSNVTPLATVERTSAPDSGSSRARTRTRVRQGLRRLMRRLQSANQETSSIEASGPVPMEAEEIPCRNTDTIRTRIIWGGRGAGNSACTRLPPGWKYIQRPGWRSIQPHTRHSHRNPHRSPQHDSPQDSRGRTRRTRRTPRYLAQ